MAVKVQRVGVHASGLSQQDLGLVPAGESGSRLARPAALMAFQDLVLTLTGDRPTLTDYEYLKDF